MFVKKTRNFGQSSKFFFVRVRRILKEDVVSFERLSATEPDFYKKIIGNQGFLCFC